MKPHQLLIIPIAGFLFIFGLLPLLSTFASGLMGRGFPNAARPSIENYTQLLFDTRFIDSLRNSLFFAAGAVFLELLLSLRASWYFYRRLQLGSRLYAILMTIILVPLTISPVVIGSVLEILKANVYLFFVDQSIKLDIYSEQFALPLLIIVDVWRWTPFLYLVLMAKLYSLPKEFLEEARVDGASETWIFRKIVFPLLTPTVLALSVLRGLDAFKLLDIVFITQGGPNSATETISYYIYETFFILHRLGYGAALTSFVTFAVELPVILFLLHSVLVRKGMVFP